MARPLRMPSLEKLPHGAHRRFVQHLFDVYGLSGRPPLKEISQAIAANDELDGTASRETVRRVLSGETLSNWRNVKSIFLVLCDMAGEDPDQFWESGGFNEESMSRWEYLRWQWNEAFDAPPSTSPDRADAPWASEPPF